MELSASIIFSIFVTFLICALGMYHWSRRHLYSFAAKLPGPKGFPIIGSGLDFLFVKKEDMLVNGLKLIEPYSSPSRVWIGPYLIVFVTDADQLQIILQSTKITTKSFIYKFFEPFLGKGLFTSSGELHKNHKKILQPLFSQKVLEGYAPLFQKHATKFVHKLRNYVDGPSFNILFNLNESAFEAAMDIFMEDKNDHGIDYEYFPRIFRRFVFDCIIYILFSPSLYVTAWHHGIYRVTKFWLHSDFIFKWTNLYKEQTEMVKNISQITEELAKTTYARVEKRYLDGSNESDEQRSRSMLEMMTELLYNKKLTYQECVDHDITFVSAGQDSQSSAIAFTCLMLAVHPDVQDRAFNEVKEVFGNRKELHLDDVSRLKFLEMCIKETLRLFPVGPFIFRETTEDFSLGKYVIPKGVNVVMGLFNVHRDPLHWKKPTQFYPEHFTEEAISKRHPYAFLPFSAGPRKCIGQQYSYINMKFMLATLLLHYKLECEHSFEDIKLMVDISIRPVNGYMVKIKSREYE